MIRRPMRAVLLATALSVSTAVPVLTLASDPAFARSAPDDFSDLAARLSPAVVNIASTSVVRAPGGDVGPEIPGFPPGSPFEQFFKDFMEHNRRGGGGGGGGGNGNGNGGLGGPSAPERKMQSLGSGFVVDPSGLIVTNNHVIDGADEITVTLQDNTTLKATLVGRDARMDIALLRVKPDKPLVAVPFGDSDQERVGQWVLAIGNPFGLGGTVTAGIVSARARDIHQGPYDDFIQTDAPINRGNSGGPLFNMNGEVIGINTAIYSPSGGSIGIGFAIPSNLARTVVDQLREFGHARRGWLGVRIQQVTPDIAESLGLKDATGAMVAGVNDGGPADTAKIRNGDIITKFNGQDIKEMKSLPRIVAETPIGKEVPVTLLRDGKEMVVMATLGELPDDPTKLASVDATNGSGLASQTTSVAGLGLMLSPLTQDVRDRYKLGADQRGVLVAETAANSVAADRGIKEGDVILEVQQQPVASPADVVAKVDAVRKQSRKSVLFLVQNGDGLRWVPLALDSDKGGKPSASPG